MPPIPSINVCPNLIVLRGEKILLLRRAKWAPIWPDYWHCPTGSVEEHESPRETIIREAYEEVGLKVKPELGTVISVKARQFINPDLMYRDVSLFFVVKDFEGEPFNKEPRLHTAMEWFDLTELPEPIIPVIKLGIESYRKGLSYAEFVDEQTFSSHKPVIRQETYRLLKEEDITEIIEAFKRIEWHKPSTLFYAYLKEQSENKRFIWVAYKEGVFVGYITLKKQSAYSPFCEKNIPEISDLNVLPEFSNQGIGSALLELAEQEARKISTRVGIGFGLSADYGEAQRLYIKKGYLPDGKGITYDDKPIDKGIKISLDDNLILWLSKKLR